MPEIIVKGLASGYEIEHLARVFFPGAAVRAGGGSTKGAVVYARAGKTRLAVALRTAGGRSVCKTASWPEKDAGPAGTAGLKPGDAEKATKLALSRLLYNLLCAETGQRPPWGLLTGVRPLSLLRKQQAAGGEAAAKRHFLEVCGVSAEKYALAARITKLQAPILAQNKAPGYSLYLSIPFCPTRCAYCSFVSKTIAREGHLIPAYLDALERELETTAEVAGACGLKLKTIYVGGGTPTALDEHQLERLLRMLEKHFDTNAAAEYTVEAGRPDCTTPEKLGLLRQYGVGRVSINPQSMRDDVLRAIGRSHTAADIRACYEAAAKLGFDAINMDLIAGLPADDEAGFAQSLAEVLAMAPGNLTLHTLTLKRASDLGGQPAPPGASPAAMLAAAYPAIGAAGYVPYYLYRQKGTVENLENTGWTRPGLEGVYNICIMEEAHSILAVGAGAVTKLVTGGGKTIKRRYNHKFPADYNTNIEEILERKRGVMEFYAGNLDS